MKKLAIGVLSSALILGACSNHSDNNDSNNKSTSENSSTNENQSKNKSNNNTSKSSESKKEYKEVPMSDVFNDGKDHLVYKFNLQFSAKDYNEIEKFQKDPKEAFNEDFELKGVYSVKDNKGFEYVFDPAYPDRVPNDITLDKLSKNSLEENKNKFHKLQEINLKEYNDSYEDMQPLQLHNESKEIEKQFYTKNNKIISENFNIVKFYPRDDGDVWDDNIKKVWKPLEDNVMFANYNFPKNKMVSVEPFTINGKTYSGIATPQLDGNTNEIIGYNQLIITEVPKDTKLVMDKDISEGKEEKYEDTDEAKRKQKQEEKEFDNL
ncbi:MULTISPECIES: hypothetical protein [Staphylococcus]|uniref:hypothetical protein n=1 Tax=Staphylococcus TaxID=1279 RepID=UPI00069E3A77|nr:MULTISPECIES: hypothetical protein [Staphylococcus]OJH01879.1 hypothetical protein BL313_02455 [Staphylococcus hominis]